MSNKPKKNNEGFPLLFSPEFRETIKRLKTKEPELDRLIERSESNAQGTEDNTTS